MEKLKKSDEKKKKPRRKKKASEEDEKVEVETDDITFSIGDNMEAARKKNFVAHSAAKRSPNKQERR